MAFSTLPFDTARRFAAIAAVAERLKLEPETRLLDVGGYPGTLARALCARFAGWSGKTVDRVDEALDNYQCASGAKLPFDDNSFDLVTSSDTLEHVPPGERAAFLSECARVARRAVVIGAPFRQPAVAEIERALDDAHRSATGRAHPWLGEHVENGLPDLAESCAAFPRDWSIGFLASAPIGSWTVWQWGALAREVCGALDEPWQHASAQRALAMEQSKAWDSGEFAEASPDKGPTFLPYRWILVARPPGEPAFGGAPRGWLPAVREEDGDAALALTTWLAPLVTRAAASGAGGDALQAAMDTQAQHALELAEAELLRTKAAQAEEGARASKGMLWRLFGKDFQ